MLFAIFFLILTFQNPEPLVLKSGTTLKCHSIHKQGQWVVIVLSKDDERYDTPGKPNKFKIKTEKINWNETARQKKEWKDSTSTQNEELTEQKAISADQKGLEKNRTPESEKNLSGETPKPEPVAQPPVPKESTPKPVRNSGVELNAGFQEKYDAIEIEMKKLNSEIDDLEQSLTWEREASAEISTSTQEKNLKIEAEINRKMSELEQLRQESETVKNQARQAGARLRFHKTD